MTLARFVFVLRNFEGYSAREIALLLDVGPITLKCAYQRAIELIGVKQQVSGDQAGGRSGPVIRRSAKRDDIGLQQRDAGTMICEGSDSDLSSNCEQVPVRDLIYSVHL
jgi:hypothetical protein